MVVLPAKTLFKYRAMDYKSLAILLWSLVYWSNSLASKGWTLLALCPFHPLWIMLFRVSPNLFSSCQDLILQPEPSCAWINSYCPRISSRVPGRPLSRTLTYCLRPFFWFTLIKETKVKDHVKWRIPLGAQWVVSACLAPAPPGLNDTALVKRITKERGWLRVPVMAPGQLLSLVYYLPRIWN